MRRKNLVWIGSAAVLALSCTKDRGLAADAGPAVDTGQTDGGPVADVGPNPLDSGPVDSGPDTGPTSCGDGALPTLTLERVAQATAPVFLTQAPGNSDTLWVVERAGRIRLVRDGDLLPTPFLDIRTIVEDGYNEQGLLGLAFHPDYATNGRFFVYYTAPENTVAEYRVSDSPDVASSTQVAVLVSIEDPDLNHNGGMLAFGPDGFLYAGTGDGGGSCDDHGPTSGGARLGNSLNLQSYLGKLLRFDVDAPDDDYVAAGNPFSGDAGLPLIFAYGLRNPWRFSFDRQTGDLYIADVGQGAKEEIDFIAAGSAGGQNFGWRRYEGLGSSAASGCSDLPTVEGALDPIYDYGRTRGDTPRSGCSTTGGYVYRGTEIPALRGAYLFGDYCSTDIAAFRYCDGEVRGVQRVPGLTVNAYTLGSFGEDNAGNIYTLDLSGGWISKVVAD